MPFTRSRCCFLAFVFLCLGIFVLPAQAQYPGWQNIAEDGLLYTTIVIQDSILWLGNAAGLLMYNTNTQESRLYNNANDGLPGNRVNNLCLDDQGDLWLTISGTGLVKKEGNRFTIHEPNASPYAPRCFLDVFTVDHQGVVWASTGAGLHRYDGQNWTQLDMWNSGLPSFDIRTLAVDTQNALWLATDVGLVRYDGSTWATFNTSNSGLPSNDVKKLAISNQDIIWMLTDGPVVKYDGTTFTSYLTEDQYAYFRTSGASKYLALDDQGNPWIGWTSDLLHFTGSYFKSYNGSFWGIPGIINAMQANAEGLWMASRNVSEILPRLTRFNGVTVTPLQTEHPTPSTLTTSTIKGTVIDTQGRAWTANRSSLSVHDGSAWTTYWLKDLQLPSFDDISALALSPNGDLWIGMQTQGLIRYDGTTWTHVAPPTPAVEGNMDLRGLACDGLGNAWMGTGSAGVYCYDGQEWTAYHTGNSPLPDNYILKIAFDPSGDLWIGTWGYGAAHVHGDQWTVYNTENCGFLDPSPRSFLWDTLGHLWIGTFWGSLSHFDGTTWTHSLLPTDTDPGTVTSLAQDAQGQIWIGCSIDGLFVGDGTDLTHFTVRNSGLPCNPVSSLCFDSATGTMWVGTGAGLASYNHDLYLAGVEPDAGAQRPAQLELAQNYPNPFNASTVIEYRLAKTGPVKLTLYNTLGRKIETLVDAVQTEGMHRVEFNGDDLPSGIYFCRLEAQGRHQIKKMLLIK